MPNTSIWTQLALGGTSVVPAVVVTHPLDIVKLRQQIQGYRAMSSSSAAAPSASVGTFSGIARIAQEEGLLNLFSGISPAIVRAYTYSATRLGMYEPIRTALMNNLGRVNETTGKREATFSVKIGAAFCSGALGSLAGNPFELVKVRMQSKDFPNYRGVVHGIACICRTEGWVNLWNGTHASIIRASLFSASQLATYDHTKVILRERAGLNTGVQLNLGAAMIAGLVTTTVSTPADFVKSIMMNQSKGSQRRPLEIISEVIARDGGRSFFRGWFANYARLGPHTVITMLTLENLRKLVGWNSL